LRFNPSVPLTAGQGEELLAEAEQEEAEAEQEEEE
jgi:hypothetical protein